MGASTRRILPLAILATLVSAWLSAGAAEFRNPRHGEPIHNPECTCRFKGENVPLGGRRCLQTPAGPRTAECVLELNVTSWRALGQACPQASLAGKLADAC